MRPIEASYHISCDKAMLDIPFIHDWLSRESYWALNIPLAIVERSIQHSLCFGLYYQSAQVGFARVVSDFATFAYLADVFIIPDHRQKGLSKMLMREVMQHKDLQQLRRWMLATRDAHGLYQQFGFTALPLPERIMQFQQITGYAVST